MFGGPNGTVLPLDRMCNAMKQVDAVLMATLSGLNRLSLSGLQEQADVVIVTLMHAITVSKVGTWVYLHVFCSEVVDPLSRVNLANPEQVHTQVDQATPGSEAATASVLQNPGGLPSDVISTKVGALAEIAIKHIASFQIGAVCLVKSLRANLQNAQKAWESITMRLGVDVWKRVEAESSAFFALQEFNDNNTSMGFICRYLTVLNEVMGESNGGKRAALRPSAATPTG